MVTFYNQITDEEIDTMAEKVELYRKIKQLESRRRTTGCCTWPTDKKKKGNRIWCK